MKPHIILAALIALAPIAHLASDSAQAQPTGWQAVKAATARYHSIEQALRDGYSANGEPCVAESIGAMGIHAVNESLASDLSVDPLRPDILLYMPDRHGKLRLVGIEYFMVALTSAGPWFGDRAPESGFVSSPPTVLGQTFDGPMGGHNPTMPWHYDLHVWLWADNPSGLFAPFNPTLSC